ncbi:MAG: aspartyl protease family protein [Phycisphaerales bacterium]|nr:aspartyl protease family protein [Phycisphaerales bacterium]
MNRATNHVTRPLVKASLAIAIICGSCPIAADARIPRTPRTPSSAYYTEAIPGPDTAAEALQIARKGINYPALAQQSSGIVMRGSSTALGLAGDASLLFAPTGEFIIEVSARIPILQAFDGTTVWERTETGIPRIASLTERDSRLVSAEFVTGLWLSPKTGLTYELDSKNTSDSQIALTYTRPGTPIHGAIQIDSVSGELRKVTIAGGVGEEAIEFTDYAEFASAKLPRRIVESNEAGQPTTYEFKEISAAPTFIRNPYAPILTLPTDFRFDPAVSTKIDVKLAPTRHHLIKALVNGEDLGWFIFDTGAGSECLSTAAAEKLKLEKVGNVPVRGVGGTVEGHFYQPASLTVGPLTIDKPTMVGIDLSMLKQYMGVEIAGIIGFGVLSRSVAVIDENIHSIELHDPATYKLASGEWTDILLYGRHPAVKGKMEGHEGYFRLDTGAASSWITVHAPAVEKYKMLEDRQVEESMMGGVGGLIPAKSGIIKTIELGGKTFENIQATLALPGKDAMNDAGTLGNIGGKLLEPFILVFDYPQQRMAFVPRPDEPAPADAKPPATKADN